MFTVLIVASAIVVGTFVFLFFLPLMPGAIESLSNDPNRFCEDGSAVRDYPVSEFGFFTSVKPGQVKMIEAGGVFIDAFMLYDGHSFKGYASEGTENPIEESSAEYWEIVSTTADGPYKGKADAHPIYHPDSFRKEDNKKSTALILVLSSPARYVWWLWKLWVFKCTGYVFIGVYPFRRVRTYPIDRIKKHKDPSGNVSIVTVEDYSDHFRVADFQYPLIVPKADTQDKATVSIAVDAVARVFNPYKAAYGTDNWADRLGTGVTSRVTSHTRRLPLGEVLSQKTSGANTDDDLATDILRIGDRKKSEEPGSIVSTGVELTQVLISDISPVEASTLEGKKIADLAQARIDREAKEERAKGDAAQLREQIVAVREAGHFGLAVLASERDIRTAQAAGEKAIIVLGGKGETDPLQAAMLHELKSINRQT